MIQGFGRCKHTHTRRQIHTHIHTHTLTAKRLCAYTTTTSLCARHNFHSFITASLSRSGAIKWANTPGLCAAISVCVCVDVFVFTVRNDDNDNDSDDDDSDDDSVDDEWLR